MPITFNGILSSAGIHPNDVRILRHKDKRATKGYGPYELWRDNLPDFIRYQSSQRINNRKKLNALYWAAFVVDFHDQTMFVGLYRVKYEGLWRRDTPMPHIKGAIQKAKSCDQYHLALDNSLKDLIGRLFIEWGAGALAWAQYAARRDKEVIELRATFHEEEFPGFLNFIEPLSRIGRFPATWKAALSTSRGVYLLTCPKTKESYVGSATGEGGFWARWQDYFYTGHGGNVALKSRDPSDYQISILETAGTSATTADILEMEALWQHKLQSRHMGLNRNVAGGLRLRRTPPILKHKT